MSVNLGKLELNLALMSATLKDSNEQLLFTKALAKIKQGSVTVVPSTTSLPVADSVTDGSLYFVDIEGTLYVSMKDFNTWKPLANDYIGQVFSWGFNVNGQLGDGTIVSKLSPVSIVGGFTDWCQVSNKTDHTLAVRTNGTIWAWGQSGNGQLGDGTANLRSSPVSVVGGFTDWCQVSAGNAVSGAVRTNGTIWTWGSNSAGNLGDNSTVSKSSPVSVVGGFTDWCQVSAGIGFMAAVRTNGTIWTWGNNFSGNLGDNTAVSKSSPVSVVGGFTDWCQVSVGSGFTAAVRTNGTLWSWGSNIYGQLGDNSTVNKSSPVSVIGGFTDWCQVAIGNSTIAAIRTNSTLWLWGANSSGQLGDNSTVNKSSPVSVVGGFTDWCRVAIGSDHTTSIRTNGTIWSWGANSSGQLGDASKISKSSPVSIAGGGTSWSNVSAGTSFTSALRVKTF